MRKTLGTVKMFAGNRTFVQSSDRKPTSSYRPITIREGAWKVITLKKLSCTNYKISNKQFTDFFLNS